MKNKLTLILCLLLVPAIAYPWAGQSIVDVLVQLIDSDVQVDSLGVGCAPSGVSGEAKIGTILPCDNSSANVVRLPSGSSSSEIVEVSNSSGDIKYKFGATGTFQAPNIYGFGGGALKLQGFDGSTIRDFIYFGDGSPDLNMQIGTGGSFALQNTAGSDTFTFSLDGDDRVMTFLGGTNTGTLTWDDSASTFDFSDPVEIAPVASTPTAPTTGVILFSDSEDYSNLKVVFPSGNVVTVATDPSP